MLAVIVPQRAQLGAAVTHWTPYYQDSVEDEFLVRLPMREPAVPEVDWWEMRHTTLSGSG